VLRNKGPAQPTRQVCQYGIRVSFWGSGTLKIVIYVENYPQKRCFRLADYHPPLWWGGVNQRTIYICSDHICACRGVNSGRHDSPYIRKLSLDHDSGEKNRGCHSVFQKYSTLLVFTSVTHASPSLTASLAIIVPTRSPFFEISKSQKSEHAT
jgi:hypothetical protein